MYHIKGFILLRRHFGIRRKGRSNGTHGIYLLYQRIAVLRKETDDRIAALHDETNERIHSRYIAAHQYVDHVYAKLLSYFAVPTKTKKDEKVVLLTSIAEEEEEEEEELSSSPSSSTKPAADN